MAVPDFAVELELSQLEQELVACAGCGFALLPGEDRKTVQFEDGSEALEAVVHNTVCENRWRQRVSLEQTEEGKDLPSMP
ncbi:hypothetical protein HYX70_02030 [Candidatus Saccharibacteria bacterium]|nr:hypothetical protein [Candidatus Saccharibacteria bacterium]